MGKEKRKKREELKRRNQMQRTRWFWIGGISFLLILGTIVASRVINPSKPSANSLDVAENLPSTDSAFNVGTRIGQAAPAFTLPDANGELYKFQPGDGHKYVLAFNMGHV